MEIRPAVPSNGTNDISAGNERSPFVLTPQVVVDLQNIPQIILSEKTPEQECHANREVVAKSGLTIEGKGGVPPEPTEPMNSDNILVDGQVAKPNLQTQHPDIKPIKTSRGDIIPARGIVKTEDGRIILTGYPTDNAHQRTPNIRANCTHS